MKNRINISANEINRFVYCPTQWYYSRVTNKDEVVEQRKRLGYAANKSGDIFNKGRKFHKNYLFRFKLKRFLKVAAIILFLAVLIVITYFVIDLSL